MLLTIFISGAYFSICLSMNEMTYPEITLFPVALFSTLCCCPIEEEGTPTPTCRMFRDEYLDLRIKYSI